MATAAAASNQASSSSDHYHHQSGHSASHHGDGHILPNRTPGLAKGERAKAPFSSPFEVKSMTSHIGAVYFFNGKGDILIQRVYRDGIEHHAIPSLFRTMVLHRSQKASSPICILPSGNAMLYYRPRRSDVTVVAITSSNANCMMLFQFLSQLVSLIRSYCRNEFHEEIVKGNFILIYELLDDTLDHGYPQLTDPALAKLFIHQKPQGFGFLFNKDKAVQKTEQEAQASTMQVTGAVGWRKDGSVKYKRNEVYVDVLESVSALLSPSGDVLRGDVQGSVMMKSYLSGMPEIKIGFNDRMENATFHPCVNLGRYNAEQVISFIPPDGEFELAKYRVSNGINLPFKATALLTEQGRTRMDVTVKVRSEFPGNVTSLNSVVLVPVPPQTARAKFQLSTGKAKYDPRRNVLVWKIKKFQGVSEHTLAATVELISTAKERSAGTGIGRAPMSIHFQIPNTSVSGIAVNHLNVWDKSGYKVEKWVRISAKSESYEIRM
jgi:AP-2 complex subunit mu-1